MKFQTINGWTKEKMIQQIKSRNNGKPSLVVKGGEPSCVYRNPVDGNCCAAGCFIPDEKYSQAMEGGTIIRVLKDFPSLSASMPLEGPGMAELQCAHDHEILTGTGLIEELDMHEILEDWINENVE